MYDGEHGFRAFQTAAESMANSKAVPNGRAVVASRMLLLNLVEPRAPLGVRMLRPSAQKNLGSC
jgi:hypothetical protein